MTPAIADAAKNAAPRVGGVILCGGKSSRMGRPKAWLPIGTETFLQRVVRIVGSVVDPVVVVAARDQELPSLPPQVLIARDEHESQGPLAGLSAGLKAPGSRVDAVYASSCDVPLLRAEFVQRLVDSLADFDLVIPREDRFHHPLAAVYRSTLLDRIDTLLAAGKLRPLFLVQQSRSREIDVEVLRVVDPDLESLMNANTPDEYAELLKLFRGDFPR